MQYESRRPVLLLLLPSQQFQTSASLNITGLAYYPPSVPNPVTMNQGLIIKGNVFVNWHSVYPDMNLGLDPCYNTGLPCDKPTVRMSPT
jgi:hypothetical protein